MALRDLTEHLIDVPCWELVPGGVPDRLELGVHSGHRVQPPRLQQNPTSPLIHRHTHSPGDLFDLLDLRVFQGNFQRLAHEPSVIYLAQAVKSGAEDLPYFLIHPATSAITASDTWPGVSYSAGVLFPSPAMKR